MSDGVEPFIDDVAIDERAKNPGTEQTGAHPGNGDIESGYKSGGSVFAGVVGKNRREQFEIAYGDGIENQRIVLFVDSEPDLDVGVLRESGEVR